MQKHGMRWAGTAGILILLALGSVAVARAQMPQRTPTPNDTLKSPEVLPDNRVVFRIYAPKATEITLSGDFLPPGPNPKLEPSSSKDEQGVWSLTVGPLAPDFYSYSFTVDGVRTLDPKNAMVKQGISSLDNMFELPGAEAAFEALQPVPHGDIRTVWFPSAVLETQRSMRVYTPPGYDGGKARYPVLYLLHGGGDDDSGWPTIGRAGFILDNLLAQKKIKPMIVVMPNGSLPRPPAAPGATPGPGPFVERFSDHLMKDIIPYVEKNFRVEAKREQRAIAGLSMGGMQTLGAVMAYPDQFAYAGVFSSGIASFRPNTNAVEEFEQRYQKTLSDQESFNKNVKLFWFSIGAKDFLHKANEDAMDVMKRHGIHFVSNESEGGHTWINWRHYLNQFAPMLF
jgi:enterochelin esterase family protein